MGERSYTLAHYIHKSIRVQPVRIDFSCPASVRHVVVRSSVAVHSSLHSPTLVAYGVVQGKQGPLIADCCVQMEPNEAEGVHAIEAQEIPWMVNKFGGTSVASAEAMREVKDIIMGQVDK